MLLLSFDNKVAFIKLLRVYSKDMPYGPYPVWQTEAYKKGPEVILVRRVVSKATKQWAESPAKVLVYVYLHLFNFLQR